MKKLLIITGPQGSGNHFFSRIFSTHPKVGGWKSLLDKYWVYPEELTNKDFDEYDYWIANVSCPFVYDGVKYIPKIIEVAKKAQSFGIDVQIAIIVRDSNINELQQLRVRNEITTPIAQKYYYNTIIPSEFKVHFLDNEALFLHKEYYLKWISKLLDFPVDYDNPNIFKFIDENPNKKYIKYVEEYWLDKEVWNGLKSKSIRYNENNCLREIEK